MKRMGRPIKKLDTRTHKYRIPVPCLQCKRETQKLLFCSVACRHARQRQLASLHDQKILELYAQGRTQAQIGVELELSSQYVGRALRRNKVKPKRFTRHPKPSGRTPMERRVMMAARSLRSARKRTQERRMRQSAGASAGLMFGF